MSRHDFTRDPCPWRLVEDMGGAYSMGLVGGGIWAGGKVILKVYLDYTGVGNVLQRFFEDIFHSRTNSNGTQRYTK